MRGLSQSRPEGCDARLLPLLTELVAATNAAQADVPSHRSGYVWRSLGQHELRGMPEPVELLAPG